MHNEPIGSTDGLPLYRRIADIISAKIKSGELSPGDKLPAIRALAQSYNVNNTTAVAVYKYLEQIQLVHSIQGSGTFVSPAKINPAQEVLSASDLLQKTPQSPLDINENYIDFASITADPAYFPKDAIRHAFDTVLKNEGARAFEYPGWLGYEGLRETISTMLKKNNIQAGLEHIHIIKGLQQGITHAAEVLLKPGDTVIVERPTAPMVTAIFRSLGAKIQEIPIVNGRLDLDRLETIVKKHRPKLFFLMPVLQKPTGICYNKNEKKTVLRLAEEANAYIIEADLFSDIYFNKKPQPLKVVDANNRVVYIKSLDWVLAPGMLSYAVYPSSISEEALNRGSDFEQGYIQKSMDVFLKNEGFNEYLTFLRSCYKKRYERLLKAARGFLSPLASYIISDGGYCMWVSPFGRKRDFSADFLRRKVLVSPGRIFLPTDTSDFRISIANVPEESIYEGIGILASVLKAGLEG